jgi:hypothetical protein
LHPQAGEDVMLDKYFGMSQLNAEQGTNYKPWLKQQT